MRKSLIWIWSGVLLGLSACGAPTPESETPDPRAASSDVSGEWWQAPSAPETAAPASAPSVPATAPAEPATLEDALSQARARYRQNAGATVSTPGTQPLPPEDPKLSPDEERELEKAKQDLGVEKQAQRALADDLVRIGVRHYQQDDFLEAARHFRLALTVDPNHEGARKWLSDIYRLMDKRYHDPAGKFQEDVDRELVETQLHLSRIEANLQTGKRYYADEQYDSALREFEEALDRIRWLPTVISVESYRREAESYIDACKRARLDQRDQELQRQREIARQIEDAARRRELTQRTERISELAKAAQQAFDNGDYDRAEQELDKLLYLDHFNDAARRLKEITRRARHETVEKNMRNEFRYHWQMIMTESTLAMVPQNPVVEWPSFADWEQVESRAQAYLRQEQRKVPREVAEIENILASRRTDLKFEETKLVDAITYLQQDSGVNIVISPSVLSDKGDAPVTLSVKDLKLSSALNLILSLNELDYHIKHGAVIIDTTENVVKDSSELRTYDVRDLIARVKDFPGPKIELATQGAGGAGMGIGLDLGGGEEASGFTGENLVELIETNVHAPTWGGDGSITFRTGTLIVKNRPDVLSAVESLLSQLRASAGMIVNIETRFVTVEDNFLEDIGVDMRNLGNQLLQPIGIGGKGPRNRNPQIGNILLDDVEFGSPVAPEGTGTSSSPGIYFHDGEDGDIRARVENLFDHAVGDPDVLNAKGGLSVQFTYLDDTQLEAILRAVRKNERINLVTAPRLSVFNTQRAHVTAFNQVSYISDYQIEVVQGAFLADPIISSIKDGIVLDVRPIISADRKYITLELRPTVAELTRPIPTIVTTLGVGTTVNIETPEIRMRKVETTITVPDGGTIVIGGLKRTLEETSSSGMPWLSDLPIVRFFTSRVGKAVNAMNLLIVVKAKIIMMNELEDQRYH